MLDVKKMLTNLAKCSVFVVERKSVSFGNIPGNGSVTRTLDVTKDGYEPLGIVGYGNTGNTGFYAYQMTVDLSNGRYIASIHARAVATANNSGMIFDVLYRKLGGVLHNLNYVNTRKGVLSC